MFWAVNLENYDADNTDDFPCNNFSNANALTKNDVGDDYSQPELFSPPRKFYG